MQSQCKFSTITYRPAFYEKALSTSCGLLCLNMSSRPVARCLQEALAQHADNKNRKKIQQAGKQGSEMNLHMP
jgi:hypothetical protein